ncbi:MAG: sugar ABC transporter permease, partial [Oscillospiraceae bacterium]|nr:sugar ABC transporter permease [Oscillospiraceae bacterium]
MIQQSTHKMSFGQYMKKHFSLYLFVAPFMVIFFVFTVLSVLMSMGLSFTQFNVLEPPKFVFIDNYLRLFLDDETFLIAVKNTIILSVIIGPLGYILSFL